MQNKNKKTMFKKNKYIYNTTKLDQLLVIQTITHLQQIRIQVQSNTQTHIIHVTTQNTCIKNLNKIV